MKECDETDTLDVGVVSKKGRKSKLQNENLPDKAFSEQIGKLNIRIQELEGKNEKLKQQLDIYKKSFHEDADKRISKRKPVKRCWSGSGKVSKIQELPPIPSVSKTKKERYQLPDIPSMIDYVMESGYYRVSQAVFIFKCINEHLSDHILWEIADPHYTAGLMELIKNVMLMYSDPKNPKDILGVMDKILCNEKMSGVQQYYLLSLLLEGDSAQLVESIACAAYPVELMKSLRDYKLRKREGEKENGKL